LCHIASVSRSEYYKWLQTSNTKDRDCDDYVRIKDVFDASKGKFGWRSIKMRLPDMNHKKIQRIMKKCDLQAKVRQKNPYKQTMKKRMEHCVFPNILDRKFNQLMPHKVFCTDITYIPFLKNFAYISVVKDIASGEVISWNTSLSLDTGLVTKTLKDIPSDLCVQTLIHSDQGFHYTNQAYVNMVTELHMIQSMSGKGMCIDNAPIESFFGHMKDELEYKSCTTFEELCLKVDAYMAYYNYERKQWTRNKMTPIEYKEYLTNKYQGISVVGL
jgi:putative transposase